MKSLICVVFVLVPTLAVAQQQPTPQVQALSNRIMQEMNLALACDAERIGLLAKVKELEDKLAATEKKDK